MGLSDSTSSLRLQATGSQRRVMAPWTFRERFLSARNQLPCQQADADDDRRNEEHQNHPGDAARRTHEVLLDAAADVEESIGRGLSNKKPGEDDAREGPLTQQHDRGEGNDGAAEIANDDLHGAAHGDGKAVALGDKDLQRDIPKYMDPEQRDQRLGSVLFRQPWRDVPARERERNK